MTIVAKDKNIWMYWPGDHACLLEDNVKDGVITCAPKNHEIGDLNELVTEDNNLEMVILNDYGYLNYKARDMMRDFCDTMKEGDIIFARSSCDSIVGVAKVSGEYFFDDNRPFFKHCRKVEWLWHGDMPAREYLEKGKWNRVTLVKGNLREGAIHVLNSIENNEVIPMTGLQYYVSCFASLNCAKVQGQFAPHKAMMLIAVMEEIVNGHLTNGFVPHNDRMVKAFEAAWRRYVGDSSVFNPAFATPFFHLANEPFWKLMKTDGYIEKKEYSLNALRESFYGAKLPDDLWDFMEEPACRHRLKRALLDKYCPMQNLSAVDYQ